VSDPNERNLSKTQCRHCRCGGLSRLPSKQARDYPVNFSTSVTSGMPPRNNPLRAMRRCAAIACQSDLKVIRKLVRIHYFTSCRAFDSLAPTSSPFGLPVYVARRPPAPFCETPFTVGVRRGGRPTNIGGSVTREVFARNC
jgi:hypothetical protein